MRKKKMLTKMLTMFPKMPDIPGRMPDFCRVFESFSRCHSPEYEITSTLGFFVTFWL